MKPALIKAKAHCGTEIDSSEILKNKNLILYFFPRIQFDNINNVSQEAYLFKNYMVRLNLQENEVLGVTEETSELKKDFVQRFGIAFHFITDLDFNYSKSYQVLSPDGSQIERTLILIRKGGQIAEKVQGVENIEKRLNQLVRFTYLPWYRKLFKKLF